MKPIRLFLILNILFTNIYIANGQSVITFAKRTLDLGKIALEDGIATAEFSFTSVGRDYLMIKNVSPDNDDVTVDWEKRLYQKGKEGFLTVNFKPQYEGVFQRKITVETNCKKRNSYVLTIRGEVVKTGKKPTEKLENTIKSVHKTVNPTTFKMPSAYNGLSVHTNSTISSANEKILLPIIDYGFAMSSRVVDFGKIRKGDSATVSIKIKNITGKTRDIYFAPLFEYIEYKATPKTLKAGEEGEISVTLDSKKCPIWGQYQADFSLITDAASTAKNSPILCFKVDIFEDFNLLTEEEKENAPAAVFESTIIDLGQIDIKSGKKVKFTFANEGKSVLQIRKIITSDNFSIVRCDGTVTNGTNGVLELELNTTKLKTGNYSDKIFLQTNDPHNPQAELKVNWKI